jgi:hypothetical protein
MEYQVPQFIEVEDKIFGPLTWKQFIFVGGGVGLAVIIFLYLPLLIAVILAVPVLGLAGALAFYKVNNRSFVDVLGAGFNFYTKDRLYLWRKEDKRQSTAPVAVKTPQAEPAAREKLGLSSGKLHDLALSLDIQDRNQDSSAE